jgi:type VI secretion system protein ImpK
MNLPRYHNSYLLTQFREFYRQLAQLKKLVEVGGAVAEAGAFDRPAPVDPAAGVFNQLLAVLESQAIEAGRTGGAFGYEVYREAQYVMAALADEIFLHLNWEGRRSWQLLESRLFQSHFAGEAVFQRIDALLKRRDPFYVDLASVYFMALSLGFEGKYRGVAERSALEEYRRRLYNMIYRRNPEVFVSEAPLFPQAYHHTIAGGKGYKLPDPRSWLALAAAVVVVWLGVSHLLWSGLNDQVSCLICRALGGNCVCDVRPVKQ